MFFDPRALILFAANALLLWLCQLVNSSLTALSLHLILLGPMLILPALYLNHRSYFVCTLLTGLWLDAALPSIYGLLTVGFLVMGTVIICLRIRFHAVHNHHCVLLAHAVNLCCIALLSLSIGLAPISSLAFWRQVLVTTVLSHTALIIIAPWFFNLERLLFELCRVNTTPDDSPM